MSSIHSDQAKAKRNQEIIEEQAAFIIDPKKPIIYPATRIKQFEGLKTSDWKQSIYREHRKIHVLFVFPWLMMGGADKFNLDLIKGLDKEKYEISIITTQPSENEWIQLFREEVPEIFNLPNFLAPEHYAVFVDYFIRSREIDLIFQSNSTEGYYLLPWIRANHPEIAIVDYVHMEEWYWRNGGHARTSAALGRITEKTYVCNSATRDVMLEKFHCTADHVVAVCNVENERTSYLVTRFFNAELSRIVKDETLVTDRKRVSGMLRELGMFGEEAFLIHMASVLPGAFGGAGNHACDSEIMNRLSECEKIVNRHEEVVNRHEEVVNRHEGSINHQWEVQKWHEERIKKLERWNNILGRISKKLKS